MRCRAGLFKRAPCIEEAIKPFPFCKAHVPLYLIVVEAGASPFCLQPTRNFADPLGYASKRCIDFTIDGHNYCEKHAYVSSQVLRCCGNTDGFRCKNNVLRGPYQYFCAKCNSDSDTKDWNLLMRWANIKPKKARELAGMHSKALEEYGALHTQGETVGLVEKKVLDLSK